MTDPRRGGEMTFQLPMQAASEGQGAGALTSARRPAFSIVIAAEDGTELVTMTEENGRLVIGGEESRWDEGAKRFLYAMMQWSGQVGLRWQDEVKEAAQEGGW